MRTAHVPEPVRGDEARARNVFHQQLVCCCGTRTVPRFGMRAANVEFYSTIACSHIVLRGSAARITNARLTVGSFFNAGATSSSRRAAVGCSGSPTGATRPVRDAGDVRADRRGSSSSTHFRRARSAANPRTAPIAGSTNFAEISYAPSARLIDEHRDDMHRIPLGDFAREAFVDVGVGRRMRTSARPI